MRESRKEGREGGKKGEKGKKEIAIEKNFLTLLMGSKQGKRRLPLIAKIMKKT